MTKIVNLIIVIIGVSYPTIKTLCDNKTEETKFKKIENI